MKRIIFIIICSVSLISIQSCKDEFEIGPRPTVDQIKFSATPMEDNQSSIHFQFSSDLLSPFWTIETPNGTYLNSNKRDFTVKYLMAGEYKGIIQAYGQGGLSDSIYFNFLVPENDPIITKLTGSDSQKTWVWNYTVKGHLTGVWSDPNGAWEGRWELEANELARFNIYDDELSFLAENNEYLLESHGYVYVDPSALSIMDPINYPNGGSAGATVAYKQPEGQKWAIYQKDDAKLYLSFSKNGFPSYLSSPNALGAEYEIIELTDEKLHLLWVEQKPEEIVSWHYHFIVK